MACCLTAPSHYLNHCRLIIIKVHDIYLRAISHEKIICQPSITKVTLKIIFLNFRSGHLPGVKVLIIVRLILHHSSTVTGSSINPSAVSSINPLAISNTSYGIHLQNFPNINLIHLSNTAIHVCTPSTHWWTTQVVSQILRKWCGFRGRGSLHRDITIHGKTEGIDYFTVPLPSPTGR